MAIKQIILRAWSNNTDIPPIEINQGDILSRTVVMTLLDSSGAPIDLTLSSVRVHFSKPDGTICYLSAPVVNGPAGMATVTLDSQCTAISGTVKSIVQITGAGEDNLFIVGPTFTIGAINIEGSIISANEFTALTDALAQVQSIANKVDKSQTINGHALTDSFSITADETGAIPETDKGAKGGVATLDPVTGKLVQTPNAPDTGAWLVGSILEIAYDTADSGWLLCRGQALSRTTYASLFARIGTKYGSGDGSTTFNIPNKCGKVGVGLDPADTDFDTLGKAKGSKTAALVAANNGPHFHKLNMSAGTGTYDSPVRGNGTGQAWTATNNTVSQEGTGDPFSIIQPSIVVNYEIYTGVFN